MAEKLNVCLISREFPPDTAFGGIATFSLQTALMLKSNGHEVTIFSQSLSASHIIEWQGLTVHKIHVPAPFGSYRFLPGFILAYNYLITREVLRCHKERPFDLIDVPDHLAEGLFVSLFTNIPVVTRLHTPYSLLVEMGLNNYRKGPSFWFIKTAEKIALRQSTILYAPCMDLVRRCEELFTLGSLPRKIFGYPVDLDMFHPAESEEDGAALRILFVGRLEQRKGIETIAAAFPKVLKQHPTATLTLVGSDTPNVSGFDSARQYLDTAFKRSNCAHAVRFVDSVPLESLPEIFKTHDIVWIPSLYDNYPLVCLEAMACAKAVIVSDAGGLREMVENDNTGLVFPTGSADALAEQTLKLCGSPHMRRHLGNNARSFTEENCSAVGILEKTIDLYRHALARPNLKRFLA